MPFSSKKKIGNSNLTGATYMKLVLGTSRNLSEKLVKYGKQVFKCKKGNVNTGASSVKISVSWQRKGIKGGRGQSAITDGPSITYFDETI